MLRAFLTFVMAAAFFIGSPVIAHYLDISPFVGIILGLVVAVIVLCIGITGSHNNQPEPPNRHEVQEIANLPTMANSPSSPISNKLPRPSRWNFKAQIRAERKARRQRVAQARWLLRRHKKMSDQKLAA